MEEFTIHLRLLRQLFANYEQEDLVLFTAIKEGNFFVF